MSYVDFEPLKPDPTTGDGTTVFVHTRENLLWLRDAAISGALMGWQLDVSGGTPAQPAQWLYSKGTERVRLTITWGASGGPKGKPQAMVVDYSSDSGTTWLTIGTATITYDANGNFTGSTGIAPGLAAHWLMGLPERIREVEGLLSSKGPEWDEAYGWGDHARAGYQDNLVSGDTIKTLAGESLLGSGNIPVVHAVASIAHLPGTGVPGRLYLTEDNGRFYIWTGTAYAPAGGGDVAVATKEELWALTGTGIVTPAAVAEASEPITLDGSSNINWDWSEGWNFVCTVNGNRTLFGPANIIPGTVRTILFQGNTTAQRTITLPGIYVGASSFVVASNNRTLLTLQANTTGHIMVMGSQGV